MSDIFDLLTNIDASKIWNLSLKGVFAYLFVLWATLVIWVSRDIVNRTKNLLFQVMSIILVAFLNIFGLLIYLIVRPQKTLLECYYEELEQKALLDVEEICPACERPLPIKFRFCPECGVEAHAPCQNCKKLTSKTWSMCAYCGETLKTGTLKKEKKMMPDKRKF